jgi:WD40 repeat protein
MDHAHTSEIRPMAEPLQLPLFPDQAALTRIRPERNEWRYYRLAVWRKLTKMPDVRMGSRVVTASKDGRARVWNAGTGNDACAPLREHTRWVITAAFSPSMLA